MREKGGADSVQRPKHAERKKSEGPSHPEKRPSIVRAPSEPPASVHKKEPGLSLEDLKRIEPKVEKQREPRKADDADDLRKALAEALGKLENTDE